MHSCDEIHDPNITSAGPVLQTHQQGNWALLGLDSLFGWGVAVVSRTNGDRLLVEQGVFYCSGSPAILGGPYHFGPSP